MTSLKNLCDGVWDTLFLLFPQKEPFFEVLGPPGHLAPQHSSLCLLTYLQGAAWPWASWYMCPGLSGKPRGFQEAARDIWFPSHQVHTVPVEESVCLLTFLHF